MIRWWTVFKSCRKISCNGAISDSWTCILYTAGSPSSPSSLSSSLLNAFLNNWRKWKYICKNRFDVQISNPCNHTDLQQGESSFVAVLRSTFFPLLWVWPFDDYDSSSVVISSIHSFFLPTISVPSDISSICGCARYWNGTNIQYSCWKCESLRLISHSKYLWGHINGCMLVHHPRHNDDTKHWMCNVTDQYAVLGCVVRGC